MNNNKNTFREYSKKVQVIPNIQRNESLFIQEKIMKINVLTECH